MEDGKNYVKTVYLRARAAGLCDTQQEFATLLETDRTTLSSAMNGNTRYLTARFVNKVRRFALEHGLEETPQPQTVPEPPKRQIVIPEETLELYTNLSETCRNLSAILARIGVPATGIAELDGVGKKDQFLDR